MKCKFIDAEDVQSVDGINRSIAEVINEHIGYWVENALSDPWYCFRNNNPIGTFFVYLDANREIKAVLSLDGLIDRTIVTNENREFLDSLADELEKQATRLRQAWR